MKRRIVIDTNVVVAGLRSARGASHRLLQLVGTGRFEPALSVALLVEYEDALTRPETGVRLPKRAIEAVLDYLCAAGAAIEIHFLWRPALPDPNDDLVLEVAVNGRCDTVVTFNVRDFDGAERFGVRVLTPQELLRELGVEP